MPKRLAATATIAIAAILASACGGSDATATVDEPGAAPPIAFTSDDSFGQADVAFAQGMIPHHSQAIEMATLALDRSTNPAVVDLATRIQAAQDPEIEQMRDWLDRRGEAPMPEEMDGMDHSSMTGMMTDAEMTALSGAAGPDFDALFVDLMVRHHEGAITMAENVLHEGSDPAIRALAEAIIAAQAGEIAEMQSFELGR